MNLEFINIAGALLAVMIGYLIGQEKLWNRNQQASINKEVWKERVEVYKKLMEHIGILPKWPSRKHETTYYDLLKLARNLRDWYYTGSGGLFLSEESRRRFNEVQLALRECLKEHLTDKYEIRDRLDKKSDDDYKTIQERLSALRKELSKDLAL